MSVILLTKNKLISPEQSGQKAFNLSKLCKAGIKIPKSYVISTTHYYSHINELLQNDSKLNKNQLLLLQKKIINKPISKDLLIILEKIFDDLNSNKETPLAIRSSSIAEDLKGASSAGLYLSELHINSFNDMIYSIKKCWASFWNFEAYIYREKQGLLHKNNGMGVIIQTMINSKYSGVLFTSSPFHGEKNIHIEWVNGIGEGLLAGDLKGHSLIIDYKNIEFTLKKTIKSNRTIQNFSKLISISKNLSLSENKELDIEWAIDKKHQLFFLQSRPITSINKKNNLENFKLANDEVFSKFGIELAVNRYEHWVQANRRFYLYNFKSDFKIIDNLIYYKTDWIDATGVKKYWLTFIKTIRFFNQRKIIDDYHNYINEVITKINFFRNPHIKRTPEINLNDLIACVALYNEYQQKSLPILKIAIMQASLFNKVCKLYFGESDGLKYFSSAISAKNSITFIRNEKLNDLIISLNKNMEGDIDFKTYEEFIQKIDKTPSLGKWRIEYNKFLDKYGYIWANKYPRDPFWKFNKKAILNSFLNFKNYTKSLNSTEKEDFLQNVDNLNIRFFLKPLLFKLENLVKVNFHHREDRNHYVYSIVSIIKSRLDELSQVFYDRNLLNDKDDIYFLNIDEIKKIVETKTNLFLKTAKRRRGEYISSLHQEDSSIRLKRNKKLYSGESCVEGIVRGRINKIDKIGDLDKLKDGDILVCKNIRPAWSYVFPRVNGVIIESGGLLSHGATLLREHNTPSIINVKNIFKSIPQYSKVIMNCKKGIINIQ